MTPDEGISERGDGGGFENRKIEGMADRVMDDKVAGGLDQGPDSGQGNGPG
jgi:hypothetical protein